MAADQHNDGILFIGGLSPDTQESTLYAVFEKFGPLLQAILVKDWKTQRSRGFAFITFQHPPDAKNAIREMNGKSLDGKSIKVEQAKNPAFKHEARWRVRPLSTNRGHARSPNYRWEGRDRTRSHPACDGPLDEGGYTLNVNVRQPRGRFPIKKGPRSRSGGPSFKKPTPSASRIRSPVMARPVKCSESRERVSSVAVPRQRFMSSWREECALPSDEGYSTRDRSVIPSSHHRQRPATSARRRHGYRDYRYYSSRDEHACQGFSDHGEGRERYDDENPRGSSHRDSHKHRGHFKDAPPATRSSVNDGGNNLYGIESSRGDGYGRSWEQDSRTRNDDEGGYTLNVNVRQPRGRFPIKRGPRSRSGGPSPKKPAPSASRISSHVMARPESRERVSSTTVPRQRFKSSWREECALPSDEGYSSRDRSVFPSLQDCQLPATSARRHGYRNYKCYSSLDEHASQGCSDHGEGRERDDAENRRGMSQRDSHKHRGQFQVAPPATSSVNDRGNNQYVEESIAGEGYGRSREEASSTRNDGRHEHDLSPIALVYPEHGGRPGQRSSPVDRGHTGPHKSYSSLSRRRSSGACGDYKYDRGCRGRY